MEYQELDDAAPAERLLHTTAIVAEVEHTDTPVATVAPVGWPELCDCCSNEIRPSCCIPLLCSSYCFCCFTSQVGSRAGWNPNWCGCHQNGPRPDKLCCKIAVKLMVVFVLGVITHVAMLLFGRWLQGLPVVPSTDTCNGLLPDQCSLDVHCVTSSSSSSSSYSSYSSYSSSYSSDYRCVPNNLGIGWQLPYFPIGFAIWFLVLLVQLRRYLRTLFPSGEGDSCCSGEDSCCSDCCTTFCCATFALFQQANLVFNYEQNPQYATCSLSDPGPMENIPSYEDSTIVSMTEVVTVTSM